MQWYYVKDGKKEGPLAATDLPQLVRRGEITDETLVWNRSMTDWIPYAEVGTLPTPEESVASSTATACSLCGKGFADDELIDFEGAKVCAGCKPGFIQQIKENAELRGAQIMSYAGFWRRAGAVFIDGLVVAVVTIPCNIGFQTSFAKVDQGGAYIAIAAICYLTMLVVPALYTILMIGKSGATVGKKAVGIKVVMSDGSPVTMGRSVGRHFATIVSQIILYIGYIMAAFDGEKRALHDHMCNTRVIKV